MYNSKKSKKEIKEWNGSSPGCHGLAYIDCIGVLGTAQEKGCISRDVVGGDQRVDGGQPLHKLLRAQLHGQEAPKLHQRVLTLTK